jgi:hypothetical protein
MPKIRVITIVDGDLSIREATTNLSEQRALPRGTSRGGWR